MKSWTQHYVNAMDDSKVQKCIYCWKTITDVTNVLYSDAEQGPPNGFPAGEIFVSDGNPSTTTTLDSDIGAADKLTDCRTIK